MVWDRGLSSSSPLSQAFVQGLRSQRSIVPCIRIHLDKAKYFFSKAKLFNYLEILPKSFIMPILSLRLPGIMLIIDLCSCFFTLSVPFTEHWAIEALLNDITLFHMISLYIIWHAVSVSQKELLRKETLYIQDDPWYMWSLMAQKSFDIYKHFKSGKSLHILFAPRASLTWFSSDLKIGRY